MKTVQPWLSFLIFILAFLVYSQTLTFSKYVCDDDIYSIHNKYVEKGVSSFYDLISKNSLSGFTIYELPADYRPLVLINFAIERSLFGFNPKVSHLIHVLFYALLCVQVFRLLKKLFNNYPLHVSFIMAVLFTLHPIHTEVVANLKSRDELLCLFFGILSLNFVFDYVQRNKIYLLIVGGLAFFLSPLSKENGYAFLLIIPMTLWFFTELTIKRITLITLPFLAIAAILILIRFQVLGTISINEHIPVTNNSLLAAGNMADMLAANFTILLHAITLLFFPFKLSWDYSFNHFPIVNWNNGIALISIMIHISLLLFSLTGLRKRRIYSYVILFYFITYFLTSNLVFKIASSFGERFLFAPSIAFCIALPLLLRIHAPGNSVSSWVLRLRFSILALVLLFFSIRTIIRNNDWKDNLTLFASGVKTAPDSFRTHLTYAFELRNKAAIILRDSNEKKIVAKMAVSEFEKGIGILREEELKDPYFYYNMAVMYDLAGDTAKAIEMYERTLQLNTKYVDALNNYGIILVKQKKFASALPYFQRAVAVNSNFTAAITNEAVCYYFVKDYAKAITRFEQLQKQSKLNDELHSYLIDAYKQLGNSANDNYTKPDSIH